MCGDVFVRADQADLLAAESDEPDRPPKVLPLRRQQPGGFENDRDAGGVISRRRAQVVRVVVSAQDDDLIRVFGAGQFSDDVARHRGRACVAGHKAHDGGSVPRAAQQFAGCLLRYADAGDLRHPVEPQAARRREQAVVVVCEDEPRCPGLDGPPELLAAMHPPADVAGHLAGDHHNAPGDLLRAAVEDIGRTVAQVQQFGREAVRPGRRAVR